MPTPALPPVLVVDDDPDIRLTLRFLLEDAGYPVDEAGTVDEAIAVLRTSGVGRVVVLDYLFRGETGVAVVRAAAENPTWGKRHAFVLMTASARYADVEAEMNALATVPVPLVRKPFDVDTMLDAVAHAAERLATSEED